MKSFVIPDIEILERLGEGKQSVVYRGKKDGSILAIKLQKHTGDGGDSSPVHFRREAAFLASFQDPCLPHILDVGETDGLAYFVQEFIDGQNLHDYIAQHDFKLEEIVSLGINLSRLLDKIHRFGIIHRDIKPKNILMSSDGKPYLIDFGLAARVSKDKSTEVLSGTFLYSPPEQTGMLDRPVDRRSDLYCLGVVLFECATKTVPFQSADLVQLVKMHAVQKPPDIYTLAPQFPKAFNLVVQKLLAKDPDDRYQDGESLIQDLSRISLIEEEIDHGRDAGLALHSTRDAYFQETALIARGDHLGVLRSAWSEAQGGKGSIVVVEAPSGMGKTRLIRELLNQARSEGALILSGKCVQGGNPLPFSPLREALDGSIAASRNYSAEKRRKFNKDLLATMGNSAPILKNFTPSMGEAFDDLTSLPNLGHITLEQFYSVLADFILNLPKNFKKVVIFIDDIQWLDEATKMVFRYLKDRLGEAGLLIICASRNDPASAASLKEFNNEMATRVRAQIKLGAFSEGETEAMMAEQLGQKKIDRKLVEFIQGRSAGIPFAIGEYVRALMDSGFLVPNWGTWRLKQEGLQHLDLPDNVIDVVLKRAGALSSDAHLFLSLASLWGARFPALLIGQIAGLDRNRRSEALAEALRNHLIESSEGVDEFAFVHDRVQEAFSAILNEEQKKSYHGKIAQGIDQSHSSDETYVYALADHYRLSGQKGQRIYDTQINAGKRALTEFAADKALFYFDNANGAPGNEEEKSNFEIDSLYAEACALTGRYDKAMTLLSSILEKSYDPIERARVHNRLARIYQFQREIQKSWDHALAGLAEIKVHRPGKPIRNVVTIVINTLRGLFLDTFYPKRGAAEGDELIRYKIRAELYEVATVTSYFLNDPWKFLSASGPSVLPAVRIGPSRELVSAYSSFAGGLGVLGLSKLAGHYVKKSLAVAEQLGDPFAIARANLFEVYILQFSGKWSQARKHVHALLKNQGQYLEGNDFMNATYGGTSCMTMLAGFQNDGLDAMEMAVEFINRVEHDPARRAGHPFLSTLIPILATGGRSSEAARYIETIRPIVDKCPDDANGMLGFNGSLLGYYYENQEIDKSVDEAIARGEKCLPAPPPLCMPHFKFFFVFAAYARTNQYFLARTPEEKVKALENLTTQWKRLRFAGFMPSWTPIRAHALIIEGILHRIHGRIKKAEDTFNKALVWAKDRGLPLVQFEAYRQKAHLLREAGLIDGSQMYARLALSLAHDFNWPVKARWIQDELSVHSRGSSSEGSDLSRDQKSSRESLRMNQQLDSLVQMCMRSIGETDVKEQTRKLLDEIIEFFGADRGFVVTYSTESQKQELLMGRTKERVDLVNFEQYSQSAIKKAISLRAPAIINQDTGLSSDVEVAESIVSYNLKSILVAPLLIRDQLIGAIYLDNKMVKGLFQERDKNFISSAAGILAAAIESVKAVKIEIEKNALAKDLQLTGAVQNLLLPSSSVVRVGSMQARGYFKPATVAGGDWWWAEALADGSLFVFLGDVTGHGSPSAMVAATVAGIYYSVKRNLLSEKLYREDPLRFDPCSAIREFLTLVDQKLHADMRAEFLMAYEAIHWTKDGVLTTWGAGSPPILSRNASTGATDTIACSGNLLGTGLADGAWKNQSKDTFGTIFAYSDGLLDLELREERFLTEKVMKKWFAEVEGSEFTSFFNRVQEVVDRNLSAKPLGDDVTYILIDNLKK